MSDNKHAEISAQRDGDVTVNFQWTKNKDKSRDALKGKFGIHLHVQYIPENKLTKNKVSKLIDDAKNSNQFDLKFAKSLVASCNKYKKVSS